jgi:hypothetical protein
MNSTSQNTAEFPKPPLRVVKYKGDGKRLKTVYRSIPAMVVLTGKSGAGKSHVADILTTYGYRRASFGNLVRDELASIIHDISVASIVSGQSSTLVANRFSSLILKSRRSLTPEFVDAVETLAFAPEASANSIRAALYAKPTLPHVRILLQFHGTELMRTIDQFYWAKLMLRKYHQIGKPKLIVIDDYRFASEQAFWYWLGISPLIIRLTSTGQELKGDRARHQSERIDALPYHIQLDNSPENRLSATTIDGVLLAQARLNKHLITSVMLPLHRSHL